MFTARFRRKRLCMLEMTGGISLVALKAEVGEVGPEVDREGKEGIFIFLKI